MNHALENPFDSIESAHDFVRVLSEAVAEAKQEIDLDLQRELDSKSPRRREALRIAIYNLEKLETHMKSSRRILNDLRSLRRLLFAERVATRRVKPVGIQADTLMAQLNSVSTVRSDSPLLPLAATSSSPGNSSSIAGKAAA